MASAAKSFLFSSVSPSGTEAGSVTNKLLGLNCWPETFPMHFPPKDKCKFSLRSKSNFHSDISGGHIVFLSSLITVFTCRSGQNQSVQITERSWTEIKNVSRQLPNVTSGSGPAPTLGCTRTTGLLKNPHTDPQMGFRGLVCLRQEETKPALFLFLSTQFNCFFWCSSFDLPASIIFRNRVKLSSLSVSRLSWKPLLVWKVWFVSSCPRFSSFCRLDGGFRAALLCWKDWIFWPRSSLGSHRVSWRKMLETWS